MNETAMKVAARLNSDKTDWDYEILKSLASLEGAKKRIDDEILRMKILVYIVVPLSFSAVYITLFFLYF